MSEQMSCPKCEALRDVEVISHDETATIKGREITFRVHTYRCATCGEEFETPSQMDANLEAAREAYSRMYESFSPEQLVVLRSRYGASQKAFGIILSFGELTMNSYEKGAVPDSTNRLLLKVAENPVHFRAMYQINSSRIGALQRQRIESSEGYRSAIGWLGLEALGVALTPVQREKIEACAARGGRTIVQQILAWVSEASFVGYSRLVNAAVWSSTTESSFPSSGEAEPFSEHEAAS
jgi:putative zinc finger/helix-turn-helix YgiT family protein